MTDTVAPTAPHRVIDNGFFADPDFDFETRLALGLAAQGAGDVGLVLATIARVTDADPESWFAAWTGTADDLVAQAARELRAGNPGTAEWAYLTAAEFYARGQGMVDGMADQSVLLPTFRRHRASWDAMIDASAGRHLRIEIPYEGTTLPGYLLRPDDTGAPRPTLVMTNGSDGSLSALFCSGGTAALARGWNVAMYDGPGQQSMLFERGVTFRRDWEAVLTPVVDTLVARPDVDPATLLAYGISQAGFWLPRALAFEHRFVAAVVDPGAVDLLPSWTQHLPREAVDLLSAGDKERFNASMNEFNRDPVVARIFAFRSRPYGISDPFEFFTEMGRYTLYDVVDAIRTPMLVIDPDDEQFWPGQSQQLYDLLPGPKELARFTRAEGANWHCQPLGRRITDVRMFDFFDRSLRGR